MEDNTKFTYVRPNVRKLSIDKEDVICTSKSLKSADEIIEASMWKDSWTTLLGLEELEK